ncbi:hypothetical protein BKA66DRAFT_434888 [Pyrenochaeta sp. MPI-SDFR-AT-0127]|nr:hypothetical protein BKA66DRAFT_434888 [Pyrenochaeta sp. MPI-SDFR-AT-0127]
MRIAVTLGALMSLTTAIPYPQEEAPTEAPEEPMLPTPTVSIILTTSLNIPVTGTLARPSSLPDYESKSSASSRKNPHWEPIPIFTKQCQCSLATARYPCWATDALQKCHFEENFSYGCYMSAAGGCPTPTRVCSNLFQPTPRSGRHPCELGPNPPFVTSAPELITSSVPALPTANLTVPILPISNVTRPVPIRVRKY